MKTTKDGKPRLKGRNHGPRCKVATTLSDAERAILDTLHCEIITRANWFSSGTKPRSVSHIIYCPFQVLEAGLPMNKFRDWDTHMRLENWILMKMKV